MAGTSNGSSWDFDKSVDDATAKIAGDVQLRKFGTFLEEYAEQLEKIEVALDESMGNVWDMALDPISLQYHPHERTTLMNLINTDNKTLNKVILALVAVCGEMDRLVTEAKVKFYDALQFYGEGESTNGHQEGDAHVFIGRLLSLLWELSQFVNRCYMVTRNVINQLASLHHNIKGVPKVIDLPGAHYTPVYEHLAELLTCLITLDEIIANQAMLKDHWTIYKRLIKAVRANPSKFNVTDEQLKTLAKLLMMTEEKLFDGRIFQGCVEQTFDDGRAFVSKNTTFQEEFLYNAKSLFSQMESNLNELTDSMQWCRIVGIFALFVIHFHLFKTIDRKIYRSLWDIHKKLPAVTLSGNTLWFPDNFLLSKFPDMAKTLDKKAQSGVVTNRQNYLQARGQYLSRDAQTYHVQVTMWMVKMESACVEEPNLVDELNKRCSLFMRGVGLSSAIGCLVRTVMNLHVTLNKPMNKTSVLSLCKMTELLKAIEHTYHRHTMMISESLNHLVQHLCFLGITLISEAKKRLLQDQKPSARRQCVENALELAETLLNGPGTKERRLAVNLVLCLGSQIKAFRDDEINTLATIKKLNAICDLHERLDEACNCSFFYWHRVVFPIYVSDLYENPLEAHRIHYMLTALGDCVKPLMNARHVDSPNQLLSAFEKEIYDTLRENFLDLMCRDIETDLRLQIHSHLQLDDRNPFRVGHKDLGAFLRIRPLRFFKKTINIKAFVERYLEKTFYNLTTVALHDWKTYGEMRNLAFQKYGLLTADDHLPSQTLEQGLDVLEIMRNIHIFVGKYLYNLYNQIFVEKSSNNKHLNTINIRHIANSIRTHGIGIMNTTVNFTYQFLRKKFYIFSQFMYDEHIKSRLIKDLRHFREVKAHNDQKYPFERAEKFNRGIRKLGMTSDSLSYLDQFRQLISQIGNAMGYVRMIRSGGLHCCHNAIRFIPDLEDIINFEEVCKEERLSAECQMAAAKLDHVIGNLVKNFTEGTEYFRLLVDVFSPVFRDPKNIHLRNFYIILPPLTLNFVEHSIACKERMSRKNKVGAAFTDDGFAMGVAYILKLLDQYHEFDSLHWFQSVREKYNKDREQVQKQKETSSGRDEKLQQTMVLTIKRLEVYQQEFELLYYTLSSARIFFRADKTASDNQKNKAESDRVDPASADLANIVQKE